MTRRKALRGGDADKGRIARLEAVASEYGDTIRDIYDVAQQSGSTRNDMRNTLDEIVGLCVGTMPDDLDADDGEASGE